MELATSIRPLCSLSALRVTIFSASSGIGRCSAVASSQVVRIQTSRPSSVVLITGIAFASVNHLVGAFSEMGHSRRAPIRPTALIKSRPRLRDAEEHSRARADKGGRKP
jgi:hypothetical protein